MKCVKSVMIDSFSCLKPCSGLIVTSFSKNYLNKDLEEIRTISKAYNEYKIITEYPPGYTGEYTLNNIIMMFYCSIKKCLKHFI